MMLRSLTCSPPLPSRDELYFLNLNLLLLTLRRVRLLVLFEQEFAEIHYSNHRGFRHRRDLDEVQSLREAICSASARVITPAWLPSAAITRTDGAEISSLRLTRFDVAIHDPPKQDGRGSRLRSQSR